jgi:hypothetical protein
MEDLRPGFQLVGSSALRRSGTGAQQSARGTARNSSAGS